MTITGIYNKYVEVAEELATQKAESTRVKAYLSQLIEDLEAKAPFMRDLQQKLEESNMMCDELEKKKQELVIEAQELRDIATQSKRSERK